MLSLLLCMGRVGFPMEQRLRRPELAVWDLLQDGETEGCRRKS